MEQKMLSLAQQGLNKAWYVNNSDRLRGLDISQYLLFKKLIKVIMSSDKCIKFLQWHQS